MRELLTVPVSGLSQINVGNHPKAGPFNIDTIGTTALAAIVVIGMGLWVASRASATNPGRLQIAWEAITGYIGDLVEQNIGPQYRQVVPLGVSIFVVVLVADWVEILPGLFHNTDYAPAPTGDINLCLALAAVVFVVTNVAAFRARGAGGYVTRFFAKPRFMAPIRMIEEIANPVSLALRLFGNLFAGGIMIQLLIAFPEPFGAAPSLIFTVVWKLFDMFIGVVQAFIFALLTILYYQFAVDTEGH
jgi:F-type H+-transporting ATPase subunit a